MTRHLGPRARDLVLELALSKGGDCYLLDRPRQRTVLCVPSPSKPGSWVSGGSFADFSVRDAVEADLVVCEEVGLDELPLQLREWRQPGYGYWRVSLAAVVGSPAARAAALVDLEQAFTLALQQMSFFDCSTVQKVADHDCCAGPDDGVWRAQAVEQFRADLRALGVTDAELDAAGIRFIPEIITVPEHRLSEAGL